MPARRETVKRATRNAVLKRDRNACQKCGRAFKNREHLEFLQVHHVKAVPDGGTDDMSNLITLCMSCHAEWHALALASTYPFATWLTKPPLLLLLSFLQSAEKAEEPMTLKEGVDLLLRLHEYLRDLHAARPEDILESIPDVKTD